MAELTFPYYQLTANGPAETGFTVTFQIQEGAGGPLPGQTTQSVLDGLRALLEGSSGDVSTVLAQYAKTTTYL